MEIRAFMGADADDSVLRRFHALFEADGRRTFPGFPEQPYAGYAANMRASRHYDLGPRSAWAAWDGGELLGYGTVVYPDRHMLETAIPRVIVDEAHRRRGIGTALLREIVADARAQGRATLAYEQVRIGSEGEYWARAVGFANTQLRRWQMLHVADVDPALWEVPVPAGYRLVQWTDAAPDDLVAVFAQARNAIADAPHGESSLREPEWTVERIRQAEADVRAAGEISRFVVAVHERTGAVAAITGMLLEPGRVDLCWQRDTAVVADHRGLGLGRVVKAAMMRRLTADIPDLGKVITNTAAENAFMNRVNEQVGYTHYADIGLFEASVERIGAALGTAAAIPAPRTGVPSAATAGPRTSAGPSGLR